MKSIPYPPKPKGSEQQQIEQLYKYLYMLAEQLNNELINLTPKEE